MHLDQFEAHAERLWSEIPETLKAGIVAVFIEAAARHDEALAAPILGECRPDPLTEGLPLSPGEPLRSVVVIYHGSFVEVAARDEGFDWLGELEETLWHELRHHLDWREGHDALGDAEDLETENLRRLSGRPFDPSFYRRAESISKGITLLAGEIFLEARIPARRWSDLWRRRLVVDLGGLRLCAGPARDINGRRSPVFLSVSDVEGTPRASLATQVSALSWDHATLVCLRRRFFYRQRHLRLVW